VNVEEKVATLEALLARVKKNAALPRRNDEMASTPWTALPAPSTHAEPVAAAVETPPVVHQAEPAPIANAELAKPAEPAKAEMPKPTPIKIEPVKTRDSWLDDLSDVLPPEALIAPTAKAETPKSSADAKPAATPKLAEIIPATPKAPRPPAPQLGAKPPDASVTMGETPKPPAQPAKVSATSSSSSLPKVSLTSSSSSLPKVSPASTAQAASVAAKFSPTGTATGMPKFEPKLEAKSPSAILEETTTDEATKVLPGSRSAPLKEDFADEETLVNLPKGDAIKAKLAKAEPQPAEAAKPVEKSPAPPMVAKPAEKSPPPPVVEPKPVVERAPARVEEARPAEPPPAAAAQPIVEAKPIVEVNAVEEPKAAIEPVPAARPVPEPPVAEPPIEAKPFAQGPATTAPLQPPTPAEPRPEPEITTPSRRYVPPPSEAKPRRSLIGVGVVALMLVAAGGFVGFRAGWFSLGTQPSQPPTAAPTTPVVAPATAQSPLAPAPRTAVAPTTAAPPVSSAPAPSAPPATANPPATTNPPASANPPATAAREIPKTSAPPGAPPAGTGDGTNLAQTRGYLVVDSPKEMGVYVAGIFRGLTGQQLEVDCGIKYVRLGKPPVSGEQSGAGIVWTSEGKSANVACRAVTHVAVTPTR
jgi:hypothetical protein